MCTQGSRPSTRFVACRRRSFFEAGVVLGRLRLRAARSIGPRSDLLTRSDPAANLVQNQNVQDIDVSVIVPMRDLEKRVAPIVRAAAKIEPLVTREEDDAPAAFEILALDQRSGDNTLSVLSLLHGQIHNLRTLQDLDPGTAIRRATKVARGRVWLVIDREVDPELAAWGIGQVFRGQRAAIVPGEILVIDRALGLTVLSDLSGGLVSAQRAVSRYLRGQNTQPAWSPPADHGAVSRARLFVRGRLGGMGLGWLDRPSS